MKPVVYIASPYRKGSQARNVARQIEAAHMLLDAGASPIAPLLNHFMDITRPRPEQEWVEADMALVAKSDGVLRLEGDSEGADREVAMAKEWGIPVFTGWAGVIQWIQAQEKTADATQ